MKGTDTESEADQRTDTTERLTVSEGLGIQICVFNQIIPDLNHRITPFYLG